MTDTTTNETSIRDALEASFTTTEPTTTTTAEPSVSTTGSSSPTEGYEAPSDAPAAETPEQKAQREYSRDQSGKFAKPESVEKPGAKPEGEVPPADAAKAGVQAAEKVGQPPVPGESKQKDPLERAPQSWKPEDREGWNTLPVATRAAIHRHEQQVQSVLRETAEVRRYAETIQKTIEPYRGLIEAEGSNVVTAIGHLLQTAQALRTAPPGHKAALVANLVKEYAIDINQLDQALAGVAKPTVNPEVEAMRRQMEQEFAPVRQMQQQMVQQQQFEQQQRELAAQQQIAQFQENAEFINDVRFLMADIIESGQRNGMVYSMQDAYEAACRAHPEVRKVIDQRERAKMAQDMTQNAQRARGAAVSVGGAPAMGGSAEAPEGSIRDAIMFAMNQNVR